MIYTPATIGGISERARTLNQRNVVLVVDDDPSMLRGVRRLLWQYGFDTVPFETAGDLKDHGDFDGVICVVLDINLGDGSGIELRRWLADSGVSLPVIYITGNDSDATRLAAMDSGCVAYLTKPFSAQSLIGPIQKAAAAAA